MKEIPGYSGYYADENGEIISYRSGQPRVLSKRMHNGYYRVNLKTDRKRGSAKHHVKYVHTLVLNAYDGPKPDDYVCRHLNGNPLDNRPENLRWGTVQENTQDSIRHGTAACLRHGERANGTKLRLEDIHTIRRMYAEGHLQKEIAGVFSISQHHVSDIVNRKTWRQDA